MTRPAHRFTIDVKAFVTVHATSNTPDAKEALRQLCAELRARIDGLSGIELMHSERGSITVAAVNHEGDDVLMDYNGKYVDQPVDEVDFDGAAA